MLLIRLVSLQHLLYHVVGQLLTHHRLLDLLVDLARVRGEDEATLSIVPVFLSVFPLHGVLSVVVILAKLFACDVYNKGKLDAILELILGLILGCWSTYYCRRAGALSCYRA